jgi:hypothetical protein
VKRSFLKRWTLRPYWPACGSFAPTGRNGRRLWLWIWRLLLRDSWAGRWFRGNGGGG